MNKFHKIKLFVLKTLVANYIPKIKRGSIFYFFKPYFNDEYITPPFKTIYIVYNKNSIKNFRLIYLQEVLKKFI